MENHGCDSDTVNSKLQILIIARFTAKENAAQEASKLRSKGCAKHNLMSYPDTG